jgi:hypothetical protein
MKKIFHTIISGGQTGVDRAALDVALELGLPTGGWCPKGRRAEDGPLEARYPLKETESSAYPVRTGRNVQDSQGTLILTRGQLRGGTALTRRLALASLRPFLLIDLTAKPSAQAVRQWGRENYVSILNVAGPRESESPGIYDQAVHFLKEILTAV